MLGMLEASPSFAKQYANLSEIITAAAADYVPDVRVGRFPEERVVRKANP